MWKLLIAIALMASCASEPAPDLALRDALDIVASPACDRIARCWPEDFSEKFGDDANCQAFVLASCQDCPATISQERLDACLDWLDSAPCDAEPSPACDWN